jgi:hypothetical protein
MLAGMADAYPHIYKILLTVTHDDASVVGAGCDDRFEFAPGALLAVSAELAKALRPTGRCSVLPASPSARSESDDRRGQWP